MFRQLFIIMIITIIIIIIIIINFITKAMENWKVKIQRSMFQRDRLPLLLFIIAMMALNYGLRKYIGG